MRIYEGGTIDFDIYHMARGGLYDLIVRYMPAVSVHFVYREEEFVVSFTIARNMGKCTSDCFIAKPNATEYNILWQSNL